jgi:prepilin-type N-terminal cleavage/methylation domain-containing protein
MQSGCFFDIVTTSIRSIRKTVEKQNQNGFTIVELIMALVIFPMIVIGISNAYDSVSKSYRVSRQLNEMYAVLSACPELDRALEFTSLSTGTNCYPNNSFLAEGGSGNTITYTPTLSVTDTSALPSGDPLKTIPDSKVVQVSTGYTIDASGTPLVLKLLITRNGVAQQ